MKFDKIITLLVLTVSFTMLDAQVDSSWNQLDNEGLKTGRWRDYHPSGNLRYTGQFKENQPFDVFKYYFPNGDLQTVLEYSKDGSAYATHYYSTGEKMAEGRYVDQKKDSLWLTYGDNEVKVTEGAYYQGKKYGLWRTYFDDGRIAEEVYMENDYEQGALRKYYDNGELKQEATYDKGFLHGLSTFYGPDGKKKLKGIYYKGSRDGKWIYYNEDLKIDKVLEYDKGKLLNPEDQEEIDYDFEEFKDNRKHNLEFEDLRGKIKYE